MRRTVVGSSAGHVVVLASDTLQRIPRRSREERASQRQDERVVYGRS